MIVTKSCSCCVGWGEFHTKALVKNKFKAGSVAVRSLNAACCFGEEMIQFQMKVRIYSAFIAPVYSSSLAACMINNNRGNG